jgi:hypothetical protein
MKLALKLDKKALQTFLLENVEKIVLGSIVVCFLLIVYGAVRRDSYEKGPSNLVDDAVKAQEYVNNTRPQGHTPDLKDYPGIARQSQTHINEEGYDFSVSWNPPLFEQANMRTKPKLYAVEEIRTAADHGPLTMKAFAGQSKGQRWVVLTGVVPKRRQAEAFKQALGDTLNTATESDLVPTYRSFEVERAEVTGPAAPEEADWKPLDLSETKEEMSEANPHSDDKLPAELLDKGLTQPLPQLGGRSWNPDDIYHPRLSGPTASAVSHDAGAYQGQKVAWEGEINNNRDLAAPLRVVFSTAGESADGPPVFFAVDYDTKEAAKAAQAGKITGIVVGKAEVKVLTKDPQGSATVPRPETVPLLKPDASRQHPSAAGDAGAPRNLPAGGVDLKGGLPQYVLFRFFDLGVQPGRQYRYRVRLVLANPNYRVPPRYLESPQLANDELLQTSWTEPSEIIAVPPDVHLLVSSVTRPSAWPHPGDPAGSPPTMYLGDVAKPSAEMMVVKWDEPSGQEAARKFAAVRGTVADFPAEERNGLKTDYVTGAIVLDLKGGLPIAGKDRKLASLGEVLVLDTDGNLRVHSELDDQGEYDQRGKGPAAPAGARPGTPAASPAGGRPGGLGDLK